MNKLLRLLHRHKITSNDLLTSRLFNENGFYPTFVNDLERCNSEVIIESPFITSKRMSTLLPVMRKLKRRDVRVVINTRHPQEHKGYLRIEAENALAALGALDIEIYFTGGHHRKLAIIDRQVLWEGSLNILSQNDSCEVMRRIESVELTEQMRHFLGVKRFGL